MLAMAWVFVRMSVAALPDRRRSAQVLVWLTLLLTGKFFVRELVMGQFNLPLALLLLGAIIAAQRGRGLLAGAAVAAGVFVKPYALVLLPWLAWTQGWRPFIPFGLGLGGRAAAAGRHLRLERQPDAVARMVSHRHRDDGTKPVHAGEHLVRLDVGEVDWVAARRPAPRAASAVAAVAGGLFVMSRRRRVAEPNYLEGAYFFVLVPLLSPQGWDYVLVLALPAYMCIVDRWRDLSLPWRAVALTGFFSPASPSSTCCAARSTRFPTRRGGQRRCRAGRCLPGPPPMAGRRVRACRRKAIDQR